MELNENYRITHDSENVILQFHEMREKQILVKEEGKATKTYKGTGEFQEFSENYYYPGLESALKGFLRKCTWGTDKAEEILAKLDEVHNSIKNINNLNN